MTTVGPKPPGQQSLNLGTPPDMSERDAQLREVAGQLEASFLAEMLKHAGVGDSRGDFGGGHGEDQFASYLTQIQAERLVEAGGIGLAERLFEALKESDHGPL